MPEPSWTMDQFSHATRVRVWINSRKPMANYLLIDISNSFTKLAFATRRRISIPRRLETGGAAAALYGCPAIVVDFGTAVTFDIVSAQRKYIGGVIAPGLEAMTNFLYQRTALLPKLSLKEPRSAVGRSTMEAMRSGAVIGYRGLVREIITRIKAERFPGQKVHVIATGGYADLIAKRLGEIDSVHPNLTLEGLRIVGNLNR